jgi:hypothetical protein
MLAAQDTFRGFGLLIFLAFLGCAVVSVAMMSELFRLLRERHPAVYDSLGRPGFLNNSIQNGFAVLRFILGGHFRRTQDAELIRLCRFIRVFSYSYWAFFIAVVIVGFILSVSQ